MFRNLVIATTAVAVLLPGVASAQMRDTPRDQQRIERQRPNEPQRRSPQREAEMPSSERILRQLDTAPRTRPQQRVTVQEFKRRPELRRAAPSIEIQAINFEFASADIPRSQYRKVEQIANALKQLISRRSGTRILIEGHTGGVRRFQPGAVGAAGGIAEAGARARVPRPGAGAGDGGLWRAISPGQHALRELGKPPRHAAPRR
jgi:hypothetical protein